MAEAARLLRSGGRYAIHEICFVPDELAQEARDVIEHDLAKTIRMPASKHDELQKMTELGQMA